MTGVAHEQQEQHRRDCEARFWLKQTGADRQAVADMLTRVAAKRGQPAADQLRAEMIRQHKEARQ